ncbi:alpha-amylase family glycosyl hydrolase [Komagataeibacter rhaeticus]|nr:alpha-amylase family glycosyl hydrolase [Komagataeibacter rhaeticus]
MLGMMMLSLRGTPYIYQGQEIGMTNFPFERIEQYDDVQAHNGWRNEVLSGRVPAAQYLSNLAQVSRDNARTPCSGMIRRMRALPPRADHGSRSTRTTGRSMSARKVQTRIPSCPSTGP